MEPVQESAKALEAEPPDHQRSLPGSNHLGQADQDTLWEPGRSLGPNLQTEQPKKAHILRGLPSSCRMSPLVQCQESCKYFLHPDPNFSSDQPSEAEVEAVADTQELFRQACIQEAQDNFPKGFSTC